MPVLIVNVLGIQNILAIKFNNDFERSLSIAMVSLIILATIWLDFDLFSVTCNINEMKKDEVSNSKSNNPTALLQQLKFKE